MEPDAVGAEGTMEYFKTIGVNLEGLESFAAMEIVQSPAMAEMSREGFLAGWQERKYVPPTCHNMCPKTNLV